MIVANLTKTKAARVMGIDCSTKSLGFGIFEADEPVLCGEVFFHGSTLYERLNDAHNKVPALVEAGILKADYIAFEAAYTSVNPQVGISLAYVYGAVIGSLMKEGMEVVTVPPIQWQSAVGNPNLKKFEKEQLRKDNPGKSESWYKNAGRELRKDKTRQFAKQFFDIHTDSDNVSDAIGISWYANKHLTRR